jgi:DNA-directed RNA polymerase specialized sigma24 family protein
MRTALVLRYYGDLNSREIGTALGIPSATVRFRLARALRCMRALLAEPDARASIRHEVIL